MLAGASGIAAIVSGPLGAFGAVVQEQVDLDLFGEPNALDGIARILVTNIGEHRGRGIVLRNKAAPHDCVRKLCSRHIRRRPELSPLGQHHTRQQTLFGLSRQLR